MRISTYKNCLANYEGESSSWHSNLDVERKNSLMVFPYSIIVEGWLPEIDAAIKWCLKCIGKPDITSDLSYLENSTGKSEEVKRREGGPWKSFFYGKTGYDFGFCEFFFKEKIFLEKFREVLPSFYGDFPKGKFKSNGYNTSIEYKE